MIKDATSALRKLLLWILGGKGGQGGRGVKCDVAVAINRLKYVCIGKYTERARKGDPGKKGAAGSSKIILVRFNIVS